MNTVADSGKLTVTVYLRENCHLCEQVLQDLEDLQGKYPHNLVKIDIEKEDLTGYLEIIPVVKIGPYTLQAPIEKNKLQVTMGAAQDRLNQLDKVSLKSHQKRVQRGKQFSSADGIFYWFSRRYMLIFNALTFVYVGLAFLAPVLLAAGQNLPANIIYTVYGRLCHQLSFRSWFLFGEQPAYPRAIAHVSGLETYEEAVGLDPNDLQAAVSFRGNDLLGYKVAFCQRDIAIYSGILVFGLIFSITKKKISPLPLAAWVVLGILPIGLDGVSQIISQLPWHIIPLRESTPFLRTLTGGLFGFSTAWFGYPIIEQSMVETREVLAIKKKAAKLNEQSG